MLQLWAHQSQTVVSNCSQKSNLDKLPSLKSAWLPIISANYCIFLKQNPLWSTHLLPSPWVYFGRSS